MSFSYDEGNLRFDFDDDWRVLKWDMMPAYTGGIQQIPGTKAVDFVGLHVATTLWLIEVKDPRGHRVEWERLIEGSLHTQIAEKVRDTIAGLVWAHRRPARGGVDLEPFVRALHDRAPSVKVSVVLWLELGTARFGRDEATTLEGQIKRELRWLNPGCASSTVSLQGITVPFRVSQCIVSPVRAARPEIRKRRSQAAKSTRTASWLCDGGREAPHAMGAASTTVRLCSDRRLIASSRIAFAAASRLGAPIRSPRSVASSSVALTPREQSMTMSPGRRSRV